MPNIFFFQVTFQFYFVLFIYTILENGNSLKFVTIFHVFDNYFYFLIFHLNLFIFILLEISKFLVLVYVRKLSLQK